MESSLLQADHCIIDYTPAAAAALGEIIVAGNILGHVNRPIAANALGALDLRSLRKVAKIASVALAFGEYVWWDEDGTPSGGGSGTGCAVNWQSAIGAKFLGKCVVAAASGDDYVIVLPCPESMNPLRISQPAIEDLAAGADFTARPCFNANSPTQLVRIGILTLGAPAGVDDSNTVVIAITDGAGNSIVSKTYNTANQPPSGSYASLGTLDATHSLLTADELVKIAVTQGATANMPGFFVVLDYVSLL